MRRLAARLSAVIVPAVVLLGLVLLDLASQDTVPMRGLLTGVCLAVSGAVMQGVLRNPLVSPFTLGLASAASIGAAITIVLGTGILGLFIAGGGNYDIVLNAFLFGLLSMLLIIATDHVTLLMMSAETPAAA